MLTETIYNYWLSVVYVGVNTLSDLVHRLYYIFLHSINERDQFMCLESDEIYYQPRHRYRLTCGFFREMPMISLECRVWSSAIGERRQEAIRYEV